MRKILRLILGDVLMTRLDLKAGEAEKNSFVIMGKAFITKYIELVSKLDGLSAFIVIGTLANLFLFSGLVSFVLILLADLAIIRIVLNSK